LKTQLYVFDLDGTLVDSRRDIADAANELLERCGARPLAEEAIGRMVGDGAATLVSRAFEAAGATPPPDALHRFFEIYDNRLLRHTRAYAGVAGVLEALRARAALAVLTNKPLAATRAILSGLSLAGYFEPEAIVGGDGPFARKPDPAGLRHLARRAGAPLQQTLLVGDSFVDWQTARNAPAGMCVARYGFGFDGFPVAALGASDRVIDAPGELLSL
jgi:phosphoglycolate phosphatase